MKNKTLFIFMPFLLLALISLGGCATPYKKLGKNGGYTDEKINDRVYKVSFQGNTHTSDQKVHRYFMRRSAEVALANNFPYFIVLEADDITKYTTVTTEGTPRTKAKVTAMSYSGTTTFIPTEQKVIPKHLVEGTIALFKEGEQPVNAFRVDEILLNTAE